MKRKKKSSSFPASAAAAVARGTGRSLSVDRIDWVFGVVSVVEYLVEECLKVQGKRRRRRAESAIRH